jgi:hypothetical protein
VTEPDPLADLAAELAELRGQLARSQGDIGALREKLKAESGQTMKLFLRVKQLTEKLDNAMETHAVEGVQAPYWAGLSREDLDAQLAELRHWVDTFLRPHYPGYAARLPRCWAAHGEAVWELSTLAAEWERVYADEENRDLASALVWHDRFLPGVLTRLAASIRCDETGCRARSR